MPNLLDIKKDWDYVDEEELTKIYEVQYNDVFSKILLINCTQFMNVLEKQIIGYLYIIKRQPIISLMSRISEYYIQKYSSDKEKVYQAYQIIKQTNEKDLEFLEKTNCFLHCPHMSEALHTCGNKFILCNDFIFCLQCKKVYNEEQAKMFCDFCGVEYYTKLREIVNEDYENYYSVCFESHCPNEKEEKIKCKNCKEDLYVDISKFNSDTNKNQNDKNKKIEKLYCLKCKIIFKTKDLIIKCAKCNKKYISEIKIFNTFNNFKTDNLCLVHTLLKRKLAMPRNIKKKTCKCELLNSKKYRHNIDKGTLLEGFRYGKKVIICDKCFKIFSYYTFNWNCPECGIGLNGNTNNLLTKELSESTSFSYKLEQDKNNLKQISKFNTTATNAKIKNIFPNNKSEIKNGKKVLITINDNNNNMNEINNSNVLNSSKINNSERHTAAFNTNNTFDKENTFSNNNDNINNKSNNNILNKNSNKNKLRENKKIFEKLNIREDNSIINASDKNNQTCNLLINSINSSIKLKNNFNDNNYNNSNNKTCIMTFNRLDTKTKNDSINNNNINKSNLTKDIAMSKIISPDNKYDYVIKNNKIIDINILKNNKEKVILKENSNNDNKLKRNYNLSNNNDSKNLLINKGNSKNKTKKLKTDDSKEKNNENNINNNKIRKISVKEQTKNNGINNNRIKIELGKNNNVLTSAKSSINIHSINNNLIKNNLNNNHKQPLTGKNDENKMMKSANKKNNNENIIIKNENSKKNMIKRNFSSNKKMQEKENIKNNNNNQNNEKKNNSNINNIAINNINNNKQVIKKNGKIYSSMCNITFNDDNNNNNVSSTKENQNVNNVVNKKPNTSSKRKINKVNINDTNDEQEIKVKQIIKRNKNSSNNKKIDVNMISNNDKDINNININNNINNNNIVNAKINHDLKNLNNNVLSKSLNGKEIKDLKGNKLIDNNIQVNKSMNFVCGVNDVNNRNNTSNNDNQNSNNQKSNMNKNSNNNSIDIIQQEENEDDNSYDYNVNKSIEMPKNNNKKENNMKEKEQVKNKKLTEKRYNFNEINQITNENNIYIHDKKDNEQDKEKDKEKDKKEDKGNNEMIEIKQINNEVEIINNKLYSNNNDSKINLNSIKNLNNISISNESSKNISSEGYQFNCDNYNIVQLLGEGTFGKIYLVEDPTDLKKYALKKIAVSDMEELGENKKEFELLMKLSQENPNLNVVKIFGIQIKKLDKFNLVMYVLMEAAQCDWECEIRNRIQYQAYYSEEELMKILSNLTTTLASLQKLGICHRDVKPQNILCFGKDNYKLSDFGEAKKKKKRKINGNCIYDFEGDTSKQTVRGTELYMSPILFKALHDCPEIDLEYNAYKSDVFSLGFCMLLSSTLGFQALYDIRELYDYSKIKKIIESYLSSRYSKEYIHLIVSMLQIKEKNRPDFIELESNILQYYNNH